jgi:hypothetical protein
MWIVRLALRRPYTVAVMSLLILVVWLSSGLVEKERVVLNPGVEILEGEQVRPILVNE